jgi:hypothetical protein
MIFAVVPLDTGAMAVGASRSDMEPVAVAVEMLFDEFRVDIDTIVRCKITRYAPGLALKLDEFDILVV